ncbi:MAG: exopolysaccharide biosynthesis protein [Pirellulaceae bacterium]|nr:MAG: exopolysaccharide biosynthesis protein [Pirellulaceae bacterium]
MSRGLNRAFIRAYDKQTVAKRHPPAPPPTTAELARIDAAVSSLPSPHFHEDTRSDSPPVLAGAPPTKHQAHAHPARSSPLRSPADVELARDAATERIGNATDPPEAALLWHEIILPQVQLSAEANQTAEAPQRPGHEQETYTKPQELGAARAMRSGQGRSTSSSQETNTHRGGNHGETSGRSVPPTTAHANHPVASLDLEPPVAPALSPQSYIAAAEQLARRQGKIVRVDHGRRNSPPVADAPPQVPPTTHNGTNNEDAKAHVLAIEDGLRQLKSRIFNPAWEVDQFQWPEACDRLLRRHYKTMELVGRNLQRASQQGLHVLAVTAPRSRQGATTVSACLAMLAGVHGLHVALVDADLERPSLVEHLNLELDMDWRDALQRELPLEEVAVRSIDDQVTLIPLLRAVETTELEGLHSRLTHMVRQLSEGFDLVVVDVGNLEASRSVVPVWGKQALIDAVATVVDCRHKTEVKLEHCFRRLRNYGIQSLGMVENFAA